MRKRSLGGFASFFLVLAACSDTSPAGSISSDAGPAAGYQVIDAGGPIAVPPDGSAACPSGACNYQTGVGCSAATSCMPSDVNGVITPACASAGSTAIGGACASDTDCANGLCIAKACHKLCCGGDWTGCSSANEHCITQVAYAGADGGAIDTGAMICIDVNNCDPLTPTACPTPGTTCQIVDATGATACFPEGTGDVGEPCPCKGGFTCVGGACSRLCKAVAGGGDPSCQPGEGDCVHFSKDPPNVGECMPWAGE